jgi:hypothetical protein
MSSIQEGYRAKKWFVVGVVSCSTLSMLLLGLVIGVLKREGAPFEWGQFPLHPLLMTIAFGVLGPVGATCWRALAAFGVDHKITRRVHFVAMTAACIVAVVGVRAIWVLKERIGKPHLTSPHAWLGLAALCAFWLQWFGGAAVYFNPLHLRLPPFLHGAVWAVFDAAPTWHRALGGFAFIGKRPCISTVLALASLV